MAHLWVEDTGSWSIVPVAGDLVALDGGGWTPLVVQRPTAAPEIAVVRAQGEGPPQWVLVASSDARRRVRVNGEPLLLDIRVLADRDEIAVDRATCFFSTETLPRVNPFEGPGPVTCPRCKTAIRPGEPSVECPGCRTRYHQHDSRPCWLYAHTCALCGRPSALDQPYAWTPAEL